MESVSLFDYEGFELPEGHEIVDGLLVKKEAGTLAHSILHANLTTQLEPYRGPFGLGRPGGWLFGVEADIQITPAQRYLPDVAGWRVANAPTDFFSVPILVPPAWVCEILSPSTQYRDVGTKKQHYHQANVDHYWLLDPRKKTLTVLRRADSGYEMALSAAASELIRADPFAEVELDLRELFAQIP
ncbi:MAG: Uma2 family endonuclease [Proteobacteria bacterium]|nr:Uma2 family endonuclease [Pseudomonadota bacterium]